MTLSRIIPDVELELSRFPADVVRRMINEMRSHFHPAEGIKTRVFPDFEFAGINIEMTLDGGE